MIVLRVNPNTYRHNGSIVRSQLVEKMEVLSHLIEYLVDEWNDRSRTNGEFGGKEDQEDNSGGK